MADAPRGEPSSLGLALGRLPSGLYILTVRHEGRATGMLASWVQQAGFEPPMLTVAVRRDRYVVDWIGASGRFTLSQLRAGQKGLIRHFARGFDPDTPAFDGLALLPETESETGGPVLADALGYLDGEVIGHLDGGDHRVYLARVTRGVMFDPEAEPIIHLRRNGFHY